MSKKMHHIEYLSMFKNALHAISSMRSRLCLSCFETGDSEPVGIDGEANLLVLDADGDGNDLP